jgi:hypothetical protein
MGRKKRSTEELEARYTEEAIRLIGPTTQWQLRMFKIAAQRGRELEPVGLLLICWKAQSVANW